MYESYSGELAAESEKSRERTVKKIRDHVKRLEEEAKHTGAAAEDRLEQVLDTVASELVSGGILSAVSVVRDAMSDGSLAEKRGALSDVDRLLRDAARVNERVLDSFRKQKGDTISVQLSTGSKSFEVVDVRDGKVIGKQKIGARGSVTAPITFEIQDLSPRERLLRMGSDDLPDVALVKGLMALNSKAYSHAKKYFSITHPLIAGRLVEKTEAVEQDSASENAKIALGLLMRSLGIQVGSYDRNAWLSAIEKNTLSVENAKKVKGLVEQYRRKYGKTGFAAEAEQILNALLQKKPAASSSRKKVTEAAIALRKTASRLDGDQGSIRTALLKRNRGLLKGDVRFNPESEEEQIRGLDIESNMMADITPLAGLSTLTSFSCVNWKTDPGKMKNLTPLEGLPLENLNIRNYPVSDISMLRKMPLKSICLAKSNVRDISALKGMELERVDLSGTKVFDFSVLAGMPIRHLALNDTQLKNISFVKGMPLVRLEIRNTRVYDFSLLKKMELKHLDIGGTQIRSLEVLRGAPLQTLIAHETNINNISPLSGMQLSHLNISGTLVKDFSVIQSLPLKQLHVSDTRFKDLELVRGLSLTALSVSETKVQDLDPLQGMQLESLALENTRVEDLRALEGMPLKYFSCRNIKADSFSALRGAPIERLWITNPGRHKGFVDSLSGLRYLNGKWVRDG
jgi:Leucine-rich repeat (LRR) protein